MIKVVNFTILTLIWTLVSITTRLPPSSTTDQHQPIRLYEQGEAALVAWADLIQVKLTRIPCEPQTKCAAKWLPHCFLFGIIPACGSKVTVGERKMSKHDFPAMKNDLILRAAKGEAVEKAPVSVNSNQLL